MANNTTPITQTNNTSVQLSHTQANGNHLESVEWLRALDKLRLANEDIDAQVQTQHELYSSYLKHKIKVTGIPPVGSTSSSAASLSSLNDRTTLFLEKSLHKVSAKCNSLASVP